MQTIPKGAIITILVISVLLFVFLNKSAPLSVGYYCERVTSEYKISNSILAAENSSCSFSPISVNSIPNNSFSSYSGKQINIAFKLEFRGDCSESITLELSPTESLNASAGLFSDGEGQIYQCFNRGAI